MHHCVSLEEFLLIPAVSGLWIQLTVFKISKCAHLHPGCSKNFVLLFNLVVMNSSLWAVLWKDEIISAVP